MQLYLLAGIHWIGLRRLRRRLHHIPDMHTVHDGHTLQQPRIVSDIERSQRMHVYLLDGVCWADVQHSGSTSSCHPRADDARSFHSRATFVTEC